jgi:hypothetical protein
MQAFDTTPMTDRRLGEVHFDDIVAARRLVAKSLTPYVRLHERPQLPVELVLPFEPKD